MQQRIRVIEEIIKIEEAVAMMTGGDQTMAAETIIDLVVALTEIDLTIREEITVVAEEVMTTEVAMAMIEMTILADNQTLIIDMITEETIVMTINKGSHHALTIEMPHNQVFIQKMTKVNSRKYKYKYKIIEKSLNNIFGIVF